MTRKRNSRQVGFIRKGFEDAADLHVKEQLHRGIPDVMFGKVEASDLSIAQHVLQSSNCTCLSRANE